VESFDFSRGRFNGIEEEKDKPEGGRRDYPGIVGTLPVSEANRLKQSIEDKCSSTIKPRWFPEMLMVKAPEGDKGVFVIRVDPDKVERPLLCQISENKWLLFIRSGRQIALPSWDDIVKIAEGRVDNEIPLRMKEAMLHLCPNAEPFIWCSLGLIMHKRRFCKEEPWTDEERRRLKSVIESPFASFPEYRKVFPWRQVFHPGYERYNGLSRKGLPEVKIDSFLESVCFTPLMVEEEFSGRRSEIKKCYRLLFSSRGYMSGTVGFSKHQYKEIAIGTIFKVVFSLADTFLREQVLKCYQKVFRTEGKANVFFRVFNSAGDSINLSASPFENMFYGPERTFGPGDILIENSINVLLPEAPDNLAKKLTVDFAHATGYVGLQNKIESLNRDEIEDMFF